MTDSYIFYDLETTGLAPRYDTPLQFAAIKTDADFKPLDTVNWRGRPPCHILPAPGALATTRTVLEDALTAPCGHYELMTKIQRYFADNAPSTCTAFNGLRYDEEMLRHSFYGTLHTPYITQFDGNIRLDVMLLAHAAAILAPGALAAPINSKGKRSFRLEDLAAANGFNAHNAHDALGDVEATIHVARIIRQKAPGLWKAAEIWVSKAAVTSLFETQEPLVAVSWNYRGDCPKINILGSITNDAVVSTDWALFDLSLDPNDYFDLEPEQLLKAMKSRGGVKPIHTVKSNKMPLILPISHQLVTNFALPDIAELSARAQTVAKNNEFADRVRAAFKLKRMAYDAPENIEDQLYSGGFFPIPADEILIAKFHQVEPHTKLLILDQLSDSRAKQLGRRLIFNEWPNIIPAAEREKMSHAIKDRLTSTNVVKWMTEAKARAELAKWEDKADPKQLEILRSYEAYLDAKFCPLTG